MRSTYTARNKLDAHRLVNFLAQREIAAETREAQATSSATATQPDAIEYTVWVADESAVVAGKLLKEFRALFENASEDAEAADEEPKAAIHRDGEPVVRVPWLTGIFCVACTIASIGVWQEADPGSNEALSKWGWRDALEVSEGSYWAVLSSPLLHPSAEHLAMNLAGILLLGTGIERAYGRGCWLALLFSGIIASTGAELAASGQLGVGASGVLFTFLGFTLMASCCKRILPAWLLALLSFWLLYVGVLDLAETLDRHLSGRRLGTTSVHAHLAGLAWGVGFALAFAVSWRPRLTRTAAVMVLLASLVPLHGAPWTSGWLEARGERAFRAGNIAGAIDCYSQAIAHSRMPAEALAGRGAVFLFDARPEEALADFDAALGHDARTPHAHAYRGMVLELHSDLDGALAEADLEVRSANDPAFAYSYRGAVQLARGELDAAVADFSAAVDLEPRVEAHWVSRGLARLEQGRYSAALEDVEHALWLAPRDGHALLVHALILDDLSRKSEARTKAELAYATLSAELRWQPRNIWLLCSVADAQHVLFELGSSPDCLDEALRTVEKCLDIAPDYWYARQVRGGVELKRKNFAQAVQDLSRALELNPRDAWSACLRGLARHGLGDLDNPLVDLDRSLELNPRSAFFYRSRAVVRHARGEHAAAVDDLNRALELNPRFADAWQLRGEARLALGDVDAGRADLKRAVDLDPGLSQELDRPDTVR